MDGGLDKKVAEHDVIIREVIPLRLDAIEKEAKEIKTLAQQSIGILTDGLSSKLQNLYDKFDRQIKDQKKAEESRYEINAAGEKILKERRVNPAPSSKEGWWSKRKTHQKVFTIMAALGILKLESLIYLIESIWNMLKDMPK